MEEWFSSHIPGWNEFRQNEKDALLHFTLLWSFFENHILNSNANANLIISKIDTYNKQGRLNLNDFSTSLDYFINRYVSNGILNERFKFLNLRQNDQPQLVEDVLLGRITNVSQIVTALLIIVLRYRNNLFHGLKWEYNLRDQLGNFETSNSLLMKIIELE